MGPVSMAPGYGNSSSSYWDRLNPSIPEIVWVKQIEESNVGNHSVLTAEDALGKEYGYENEKQDCLFAGARLMHNFESLFRICRIGMRELPWLCHAGDSVRLADQ